MDPETCVACSSCCMEQMGPAGLKGMLSKPGLLTEPSALPRGYRGGFLDVS